MNYCSHCGARVSLKVPPGDNFPRHVCDHCGTIHYQNPKVVVGALATWDDKILMCKRAIEPRYGCWTLPAGFMENNETCGEAAIRETTEEAGARIALGPMFTFVDLPHISQIHIIYRARLLDLDFQPGEESLEATLMSEEQIPWDEIAFRSVSYTLKAFFEDRRRGLFDLHTTSLSIPLPDTYR
ncbi:MAG: NUDIX hydrolase [Zoogloea sp.]|uniref:NUDIX hydrolase n=1 Tax=Zoogloea sp. TaxID=49181 RepID=UPI002637A839|nr:NUDIX hydrolase [Zoogloea sp.]MDD3328606.1 NUDIX hydrolase [Zoogloea sp.]